MLFDSGSIERQADEDHRVVRGAVTFGAQNGVGELDGVVGDAVDLWDAAQRVRVLHLAAVGVAVGNVRRSAS